MQNHELIIRISLSPKNKLTINGEELSSQTMPTLRLTDGHMGENVLMKLLGEYAVWSHRAELDPKHIKNVQSNCRKILLDCGWTRPEHITEDGMMEWMERAKRSQRRNGKTRNHYRAAMLSFCSWMVKKKHLDTNPLEDVPQAKEVDSAQWAVPTMRQVTDLIESTRSKPRRGDRWLAYAIAASTGLRKGEIKKLRVKMLVLGNEPTLVLPASITKNRKKSVVFVPEALLGMILGNINLDEPESPIVRAALKCDGFNRDLMDAGIPKVDNSRCVFTFHSLRHYFNMTLADSEVDSETRRKLMRHSSLKMTEGVYTRTNAERLNKKVNEVSFFAVDSDADPPIDYGRTENDPMNMVESSLQGVRFKSCHPDWEPKSNLNTTDDPVEGVGVAASSMGSVSPDAGGGDTSESHDDVLSFASSTPNGVDRPAQSSSRPLPGRSAGLSDAAAPTHNPTRSIEQLLAEAFSAGVRVGRGMNGDQR